MISGKKSERVIPLYYNYRQMKEPFGFAKLQGLYYDDGEEKQRDRFLVSKPHSQIQFISSHTTDPSTNIEFSHVNIQTCHDTNSIQLGIL